MIAAFPAPVLSVTADAVRDLEGGEALSSLWTLFAKCKESLKDGRRLENISWRLWYRELAAQQTYRPLTPETSSPTQSDSRKDFPFFSTIAEKPIRHDEHLQQSMRPQVKASATLLFTTSHHQYNHSSSRTDGSSMPSPYPSSRLSISFGPSRASPPIGKIIVDMLPNNVVSNVRSHSSVTDPSKTAVSRQNIQPYPIVSLPEVSVPAVCLPSTPPSTNAVFPRVVVVNPTPHPTPPATPILGNSATAAFLQSPSTHLLPPLQSPALMSVTSPLDRRDAKQIPQQQLSPPRASRSSKVTSSVSTASETGDDTLKASDRRFFLQQSPERDSPERGDGSTDGGKVSGGSDVADVSSEGSSQPRTTVNVELERPAPATNIALPKAARKGKETMRHIGMARPAARRAASRQLVPTVKRQQSSDAAKHRPTFNIGSSSSNGSKGLQNGSGSSSKVTPPPPLAKEIAPPPKRAPSPVKTPAPTQGRRIVVASSASSDYETTDSEDDDESWASEEMSGEENDRSREETRLQEAALEAQRQRDMFAKVPKRSYSNLNRTQSGLLTALLNPDPTQFPPNHPYRTSRSTQDFTQLPRRSATSGFTPMAPLTTSKSTALLPKASQTTAQALAPIQSVTTHGVDAGYQSKGRPEGQEMEEDTDSGDDDKIQISQSVAQQRLAALTNRKTADRAPVTRPQPSAPRPSLPTVTSAPIPFGHPYNLPAPAPPSTPRTTRRQMLSTELSESLRRNLLWERQVSKNVMAGQRRQSATAVQPLTTNTTTTGELSKNDGPDVKPTSHKGNKAESDAKEERRRRAMARNRSWADDYHYSGW